jgi:membrane protein CcdC involved in cytochrome C biogenesis
MYKQSSNPEPGGCRETLLLIRIAFSVLLPPLFAVGGAILFICLFFILISIHPLLTLIPIGCIASALYWLSRRDKNQAHDDLPPP